MTTTSSWSMAVTLGMELACTSVKSDIAETDEARSILLQRKYARIVKLFAEQTGQTYEQALDFFYNSKTFELISEGVAHMHCLSDEYLAEELMIERDKQHS